MNRIFLAAALLTGFFAALSPAQAQTKVGDWTVEKRDKDTHCNASRGYKDPDDDNRDYAMVITYSTDKIVFVVVYDGWEWEKAGDILKAEFATDKDDIMKKVEVGGDGQDHGARRLRVRPVDHGPPLAGDAAVHRFRGR